MGIDQTQWEYEVDQLEKVLTLIRSELEQKSGEVQSYKSQIRFYRKNMWEDMAHNWQWGDVDAAVSIKQQMDHLRQEELKYNFSSGMVKKLEKMVSSPYFARIDFHEKGMPDEEQIYIGIASLFDNKTRDIIVYDWRAPISSVFYDFELGKAWYHCREGEIQGEVLLKRQYGITDGHLDYAFDSSIQIKDDVLQQILSKNVDDKMKTIVTSIQKEQNKIIRNEEDKLLIVQGVAGSGKTSIALHRVAYLLYKYRDVNFNARNIVIFSPNKLFNDYISNVLPELGEENMRQTTFMEAAGAILGEEYQLEDMNEQMEYLLKSFEDDNYTARVQDIRLKASTSFLQNLKAYLRHLEEGGIRFEDIVHRGRMIISRQELEELFHKDYKGFPVTRRLNKIKGRILYLIRPFWKERLKEIQKEVEQSDVYRPEIKAVSRLLVYKEFKVLRDRVDAMLSLDIVELYCRFLEESKTAACIAYTSESLGNHHIPYEDVAPLVFLKGSLVGWAGLQDIRHVVIDEAQDYTPLQYEIIKHLFPYSGLTLLGDLNQSIHPFMNVDRYETAADTLGAHDANILYLHTSYRSTREIIAFTRAMLPGGEKVEYVNRPGEMPLLIEAEDGETLQEAVVRDVKALREEGSQSIAILCRTASESAELYNTLKKELPIHLITREDEEFKRGIVVIPSYLAKGLEFDAVIVYDGSDGQYHREEERKLLYTACTRALHKLHIFYLGQPSPFIREIDAELYEMIDHHACRQKTLS